MIDVPSRQTCRDSSFFMLHSSAMSLTLSIFCLGLFLWSYWDKGCLDIFNNGMSTLMCAFPLSQSVPAFFNSLPSVLFVSLVIAGVKFFFPPVCMQDALMRCVNVCISSCHQDSDGAFEAARGGRNGGWNWGSSSYRDQWHLGQSATLQQWWVLLHKCVCVSVWVCVGIHTSNLWCSGITSFLCFKMRLIEQLHNFSTSSLATAEVLPRVQVLLLGFHSPSPEKSRADVD